MYVFRYSYFILIFLLSFVLCSCSVLHEELRACENTGNQSFTCDRDLDFASCVEHYRTILQECRIDLERDTLGVFADVLGFGGDILGIGNVIDDFLGIVDDAVDANFSELLSVVVSSVDDSVTETYDADFIVKYNAPFELIPDPVACADQPKRGIAFVHGYSDSPYSFKSMAEYFQSICFTVRVILLPGHGTIVGDLAEVSYQGWVDATSFVLSTFLEDSSFEEIYIGGFSIGVATLVVALDQLETVDLIDLTDRINGFFMFSPAFSILDQSSRFAGVVSNVIKYLPFKDEVEYFRYQNDSFVSIAELDKIFAVTRDIITSKDITIPVFMYFSREDATINQEITLDFFENNMISTNSIAHVLYSSEVNPLPELIPSRISYLDIFNRPHSIIENAIILSASHISHLVYPGDPFYGASPLYSQCSHYSSDDDAESLAICLSNDNVRHFGERIGDVLDNTNFNGFRRLSYNPFYEEMLDLIDSFLDSL